jgi:hypothetical protein
LWHEYLCCAHGSLPDTQIVLPAVKSSSSRIQWKPQCSLHTCNNKRWSRRARMSVMNSSGSQQLLHKARNAFLYCHASWSNIGDCRPCPSQEVGLIRLLQEDAIGANFPVAVHAVVQLRRAGRWHIGIPPEDEGPTSEANSLVRLKGAIPVLIGSCIKHETIQLSGCGDWRWDCVWYPRNKPCWGWLRIHWSGK